MKERGISTLVNNFMVTDHFNLKEFECPCCHRVMIHEYLLRYLEEVRKDYDNPIIITSGYRCPMHNLYVGGEEDSKHQYGEAVDVRRETGLEQSKLYELLLKHNKSGSFRIINENDHYHIELKKTI